MMKKNPLLVPSAFIVTECMFLTQLIVTVVTTPMCMVNYPSSESLKAILVPFLQMQIPHTQDAATMGNNLRLQYYRYENNVFINNDKEDTHYCYAQR